jgi:hypothetical protein
MLKVNFDPLTYQFYCLCRPEEAALPKAAGFKWDPLCCRYTAADPSVAAHFASCGDAYVNDLLADALGSMASLVQRRERHLRAGQWVFAAGIGPIASNAIH